MTDIPSGYSHVPEEDRKKAQVFFDRGRTVAGTGNYEYAIEMFITGLQLDPEEVEAHKYLREISLKRKASGGKSMGMFDRMKLSKPTKDDRQNLLNCEKLLAFDPGNTDYMVSILQHAHRGGYFDTAMWVGPILQKANADAKSPEFNKFIILKDIYKQLGEWKLATDACHYAIKLKPDDMDLQTELKNLGAQHTMKQGGYGRAKSFRESMRDADTQNRLLERERDVHSEDVLSRAVREAETDWNADPEDQARFAKYIEALRKTEQPQYETIAVQLLNDYYERTKQFRYRKVIGDIRLGQLMRQERQLREAVQADRNDPELIKQYQDFVVERNEIELAEFQLVVEAYPTESNARFQVARRLFALKRYQEAIPVFQNVRNDPKFRVPAAVYLGESFLEAGFVDEAVETLRAVIDEYPNKGDERSREMFYWYARALEESKDLQAAVKAYSQVAQWDFNYRDVQARVKRLRAVAAGG